MKKLTLLLTGVFALALCSFAVQPKDGVKKIGENLYEVDFKKPLKEVQNDELFKLIDQNYDLSALKAGKVEKIELAMMKGAGPNWAVETVVTPWFVYKKAINYDNVEVISKSSQTAKVKRVLESYSK